MHDVIGTQQHVAFAGAKGAGQRALGDIGQVPERGLHHDLLIHFANGGWRKHAVANEIGNKARGRPVVQRVGVIPLVQLPFVHDTDGVADGKGLQLVVRDEQGRGLGCLQDVAHFMRQALAQIDIQVGERLVQQQQLRAWCQGARQRNTLLLPTRKFMGEAALAAFQPDQCQNFLDACRAFGGWQLMDAESHIAANVEMGEQRIVLEHHADASGFRRQLARGTAHDMARETDIAACDRFQAGHRTQQGGLAATGGANQHADLTGVQPERHVVDGGLGAPGIVDLELGDLKKHGASL